MFIKLIEIYHLWEENKPTYKLREIVINKKNINEMRNYTFSEIDLQYAKFPEGINPNLQYTELFMVGEHRDILVIGDLNHIYALLEKDSELNYRQTLRG